MKAFPKAASIELGVPQLGMDLRDYFAAKVLQGMCANTNDDHNADKETYDEYCAEITRCSYKIADAMMKARQESSQNDTK
jgi:hypothetical protein